MTLFFSFFLALSIWLTPTRPVSDTAIRQVVRAALRTGDAEQLSAQFSRNLELIIDAEKVQFSSVQATHAQLILRSFFRKYPPRNFQFVYQGASDRLRYSTGTYQTNGESFTVYVLFRQSANRQFSINALHFRKE